MLFLLSRGFLQAVAQKKQFGTRLPDPLAEIVTERARIIDASAGGYIGQIVQWWYAQGAPPISDYEARTLNQKRDESPRRAG